MNRPAQQETGVNALNSQISDLTNVMRNNLNKAMDRGVKLDTLDNKIEDLDANANAFKKTSGKTKSKFVWKNIKWKAILIAVIVILVLLILLAIALGIYFGTRKY